MSLLDEALAELNSLQRVALEVDSHCAVIAPPGSGKTKLLVTRMARDLRDKITAPRGAACVTLTTAAAGEVNRRFGQLSNDSRSNLYIGTVHGFALNKILRPYAGLSGMPQLQAARVLRKRESEQIWAEAVSRAGIADDYLLFNTVRKLRSELAPKARWDLSGSAARARDAYLALLRDRNLLDYISIIEQSVAIVENNEDVRNALRAAFERIYVDEYQDLAPGLDRIVRDLCLSGEPGNSTLFAVGDVDQAIYGWTGTDSRLLAQLADRHDVAAVTLETNYRCGAVIAQASRRLFSATRPMVAEREGGAIHVIKVPGAVQGQVARVVQDVATLIDRSVAPDAIGVLCRTNELARGMAQALNARSIDTWVREEVEWESMVTNWLERACGSALGTSTGSSIGSLIDELSRIAPELDLDARGKITTTLLGIESGMSAAQLVSDLIEILASAGEKPTLLAVDDLAPLLEYLQNDPTAPSSVDGLAARQLIDGRVYVTTLSAGKGLEFDHVFIPDCDDGHIPYYNSVKDPREYEEERNKFYVGLTRARLTVTLLWSGYTLDKRNRAHATKLSRFVSQLGLS